MDTLPEKVERQLASNRKAIYIGDVPDKYKEEFMHVSETIFENDHGQTLVHYMDTAAIMQKEYNYIIATLESIMEWMRNIEARLPKETKKEIISVRGTPIHVKKEVV